ncbi:hypothetical protein MED01_002336 [Micromonospora sp. MED01]|uniref:hypothetical protein n=1 Tax=Micromonospora alfalfae TaxID=2911212 RepID=UPI001EE803D9|nr:hypothetical protein [Micromonospora alfalfae]MCG5464171.1 hypothetical protein [Micromonospora alfalfae]
MTAPEQVEYAPLTPVSVERKLRTLVNSLTNAQSALAEVRDAEVSAKHTFERAHRGALLSGECPKVSRGGHTTAERDAWVEEKCAAEREAYDLAEARRKAAEDHLRTLRDQSVIVATLAKSVNLAYSMAGTGER